MEKIPENINRKKTSVIILVSDTTDFVIKSIIKVVSLPTDEVSSTLALLILWP